MTTISHDGRSTAETGDIVDAGPAEAATTGRPATTARRRPQAESTKFADRAVTDPEATLQEQLQDDRYVDMRADMGAQFVEDVQIPNYGDMWVPGYKLITESLAKEFGLAGMEDDPFEDLPLDEPQPATGAVDGNMVVSFVDGVTGQAKHDVLNCGLLAQLAANAKFDREEDPVNWTRFYARVLENIGWVVPQMDFRRLQSSQSRFTMDSAIIKVIAGLLTGNQLEVMQASIEALKNLNDGDRRAVIFSRNSVNLNQGNFQIDNVGVSPAGVLSMRLSAFGFKTNEQVTKVLFFSFPGGSTDIRATRTTLVLNEQVHDRLRDPILQKLGDRGLAFIGGLELAE